MGGRSDAGLIRHGQTTARPFAEFNIGQLPEVMAWLGSKITHFEDDTLLIRRQLTNQNGTLRSKSGSMACPLV